MSIEESERSFRVVISCMAAVFVAFLCVLGVHEWRTFATYKAAFDAGYVQQVVDGEKIWVKERDNGH